MKHVKRIFTIAFILIILLVILAIVAIVATGGKIMFHALDAEGTSPHLIVLGTTVEGRQPSPMLEDRIEAAGKYMQAHPNAICVVSGAKQGDAEISEALCIYNGLRLMGIEHDRIIKEEKATNTIENIQYSLELLQKRLGRAPKKVGIVSSEFHLYRASMIAENFGVESFAIPASTSNIKDFITCFCHEIFEVWRDWFQLKFK